MYVAETKSYRNVLITLLCFLGLCLFYITETTTALYINITFFSYVTFLALWLLQPRQRTAVTLYYKMLTWVCFEALCELYVAKGDKGALIHGNLI